ncbi:Major facilitator superfamily [Neofusicoccum parvum]|nr:Major facilitator superfamily [Neofusicoccum parvum]
MVNWTGDVDAKLFAAALKQVNTSLNYQQLAADMAAQGIECTPKACTHRIAIIKNRAKAGGSTPTSTPTKAPATPRGNKRAMTGTPKSSGPAKRVKRNVTPASSDVSDDEEAESKDPDGEWGGRAKVKSEGEENGGGGGRNGRGRSRSATAVATYKEESDDDSDVAEEFALFKAAEAAAEEEV